MMKKLIISILAATALLACNGEKQGTTTSVFGRFVGSNVDSIFLERVSDDYASTERIASASLADNGAFNFEFTMDDTTPRFYRLSFTGDSRPIMLVVAAGDNIRLESAGNIFLNYEVEGSEESALIRDFNRSYFAAGDHLARIINSDTSPQYDADWQMTAYRTASEAITSQVSFIGANQDRLAAFYALHQNVAESYIPLLSGYGVSNAHRQSLIEGLSKRYPDSPYIAVLEQEIADEAALKELTTNISVSSYPDIELSDMFKQTHRLSDYDDKVVLLYFWTAGDARCNNINAELKELYAEYHDKGFEVFHVSADEDVSVWISAVRAQKLPWVSLYGGDDITVFTRYNVTHLPTAYLIDREGNMKGCSLDMNTLESDIKQML